MRKSLGRLILFIEDFQTLITEIEAVINTRPYVKTFVPKKKNTGLRPIDFLIPHASLGHPTLEQDHEDPEYLPRGTQPTLFQIWQTNTKTLDQFLDHLERKVFLSLTEKHIKYHKRSRRNKNFIPVIGEIVQSEMN